MAELRSTSRRRRIGALTNREIQVARLRAAGLAVKEVAVELNVAKSTADLHLWRVHQKLGVSRREQILDRLRGLYLAPAYFGCKVKRSYAKPKPELVMTAKAS